MVPTGDWEDALCWSSDTIIWGLNDEDLNHWSNLEIQVEGGRVVGHKAGIAKEKLLWEILKYQDQIEQRMVAHTCQY